LLCFDLFQRLHFLDLSFSCLSSTLDESAPVVDSEVTDLLVLLDYRLMRSTCKQTLSGYQDCLGHTLKFVVERRFEPRFRGELE
jgi:hypothetical protein